MRSLTLCSLVLALSACGGDKGTSDTDTSTGEPVTGTASASSTGAGGSTGGSPTTGAGEATASSDATSNSSSGAATITSTTDATTGPVTTSGATGVETTTGETTADTTTADTTTADTTTGATSDLVIAIVDAELWADCMPEIEPDPVQGSWFVEFDNTANAMATTATLTKASLSLLDADPPMLEEIAVSPTDSGPIPAGEQTSVEVEKLKGAAHSGCQHCGQFYLLALEYQEGDVVHHVTEEVTISCAL